MEQIAANKAYYKKVEVTPHLSREEEVDLIKEYKRTGSLEARDKVILSNQKLAIREALKYSSLRIETEDLLQEANIGMINAFRKFDPDRGMRFMTYAAWWIRSRFQNYLYANGSFFKNTTQSQRILWSKVVPQVMSLLDNGCDEDEAFEIIADLHDVSPDQAKETYRLRTAQIVDLGLVEKSQLPGPDDLSNEKDQTEKIRRIAFGSCRRDVEREIVSKRLLNDEPVTLFSIAKKFGFSRERIRQIEMIIMKRIKAAA